MGNAGVIMSALERASGKAELGQWYELVVIPTS